MESHAIRVAIWRWIALFAFGAAIVGQMGPALAETAMPPPWLAKKILLAAADALPHCMQRGNVAECQLKDKEYHPPSATLVYLACENQGFAKDSKGCDLAIGSQEILNVDPDGVRILQNFKTSWETSTMTPPDQQASDDQGCNPNGAVVHQASGYRSIGCLEGDGSQQGSPPPANRSGSDSSPVREKPLMDTSLRDAVRKKYQDDLAQASQGAMPSLDSDGTSPTAPQRTAPRVAAAPPASQPATPQSSDPPADPITCFPSAGDTCGPISFEKCLGNNGQVLELLTHSKCLFRRDIYDIR